MSRGIYSLGKNQLSCILWILWRYGTITAYFSSNIQPVIVCTIRIYNECGGRIEKSVLRITVWHHKAFLPYPHTNNRSFFLLTTVFYLKKASRSS